MSERIVKIGPYQVVPSTDFEKLGSYPRSSLDHVVEDAITDLQGYVAFAVSQSGPAEVVVSTGRYYAGGKVYAKDDSSLTLDLLALLPAVTRRVVSIVVWGSEVATSVEPRTFVIDVTTKATEARQVATELARIAQVDRVAGTENVDPQPPAVAANVLPIAHVTLTPTGIESIEMIDANRLVSVKSLDTRLTLVEKRLAQAGSRIDTLGTDLSSLAALLATKADKSFVNTLAGDFARTKRLAELPDDYMAWSADNYMTTDLSDTAHAQFDCRVERGLHFSGAKGLMALSLVNPLDDRIQLINDMVYARPQLIRRLAVTGRDLEIPLATYTTSTTTAVRLSRSRTEFEIVDFRMDDTPPVISAGGWTERRSVVDHANETLIILERRDPVSGDVVETWTRNFASQFDWPATYASQAAGGGPVETRTHYWMHSRLRTIDEPYINNVTTTETVQGFQVAQTVLNTQEGALGRIGLFFTRKASAGDVHVFVTGVTAGAVPQETAVLARATLTPAQILADASGQTPTYVDIEAAGLVKGRLYTIWIVSQGAHFLAAVRGDKYAQGQLWQRNDGQWIAANGDTDLAIELWYHGYVSTRVEVQLNPAQLAGGIEHMRLNCDTYLPSGTAILIEGQIGGVWRPLSVANDANSRPFAVRPPLVPLRAVLIGTTDAMPAFGIGNMRSCLEMMRGDAGMVHVSTVRTLPAPATTVEVILRARHWSAADHALQVELLTGAGYATVETADATTAMPEPATPDKLMTRKFVFNLAAPVTSYKIKITGTTSDVLNHYYVAERTDVAYS